MNSKILNSTTSNDSQLALLASIISQLDWKEIRLVYNLEADGHLPRFKSSAWRGMLGHMLKDQLPQVYERIFEVNVQEDHVFARRYKRAPNPYIVYVPSRRTAYQAGDRLGVHFTLIGDAADAFPMLMALLQDMAGRGLGPEEVPMSLQSLTLNMPERWQTPVEGPQRIGLYFRTPLSLRSKDQGQPPSLPLLVHRLAERMALLAHFHCRAPLINDFEPWVQLAEQARTTATRLRLRAIPRYSNRNKQHMNLTGVEGYLEFAEVAPELLPLLHLGSILHLGKATVMGMGKYDLILLPEQQAE